MIRRAPISRRGRKIRPVVLLSVATILCATAPAHGQSDFAALSRRFEDQKGPVRKAEFFPKLGDAYIGLVLQHLKSGHYDQALSVLETYSETVKNLQTTLRELVPDLERKSDGFRQLEVHLRKSIRILNDVALELPVEQRGPFKVGIQGLQQIDSELIEELFPRRLHSGR
jgi:hypothetical protein